jgi:NAD(P)H-dependent flavin oxidoreductase YrpB (nitropropane dioxygenase family)
MRRKVMIKTAITEMFGVKYPIICGAMMWLCKPELCAAISNAGGLGNLTAGGYQTEDEFRNAIRETRKLTDNPFMVNIAIIPSVRLTTEHHRMYVKVSAEERVAGVEISGAPLDKGLGMEAVDTLKKAGVKMFQKVGSVKHAILAEKIGYDGIYALGFEGGGHPLSDDVSTMVLTPKISDSVKIPVVAVGGIADGRSLAAALTLGASGVMMASRFIATKEAGVHNNIKNELVKREEFDTAIFGQSYGLQGRALKGETLNRIRDLEKKGCDLKDILPFMAGDRIKKAWKEGLVDYATLMVGQSIGLIDDIPSCRELVETMGREAEQTLSRTYSQMI